MFHRVLLMAVLPIACADPSGAAVKEFRFSAFVPLPDNISEVRRDGSPYPITVDERGRSVRYEQTFDDYKTGMASAPVVFEFLEAGVVRYSGMLAPGVCQRWCACVQDDNLRVEEVELPAGMGFAVGDRDCVTCRTDTSVSTLCP